MSVAAIARFSQTISFFFSSRRRHTIYIGDWSSDVCSSDLPLHGDRGLRPRPAGAALRPHGDAVEARSEERRVGKECRRRWLAYHYRKTKKLWERDQFVNRSTETVVPESLPRRQHAIADRRR